MQEIFQLKSKIKAARQQKGMTQAELGKILGVSQSMIGQYESGARRPKIEQLIKISDALDIDINTLLENTDSPVLRAMQRKNSPLYQDYKQHLLSSQIELAEIDIELINNFHKLNDSGQKRLFEYLSDILKIDTYTKGTP